MFAYPEGAHKCADKWKRPITCPKWWVFLHNCCCIILL